MPRKSIYLSLALITFATASSFVSFPDTGYARYFDGIGGQGASSSPRGNNGVTNYHNKSSGYFIRATYTPHINNTYYNDGGFILRPRSRSGDFLILI
tara:strand:+ start:48 stop:338 length:291 start_codon:yes stop_codon:yes gene_type:complete